MYELFVLPDAVEDSGLLYTGADFLPDVALDAELLLPALELLLTVLLEPIPLRTAVVLLPMLEEPDEFDGLMLLPSVCALIP